MLSLSTGSWVELQGKALPLLRCTWPLGSLSLERGAVCDARNPTSQTCLTTQAWSWPQQHRPCPPNLITILGPAVATKRGPASVRLVFSNVVVAGWMYCGRWSVGCTKVDVARLLPLLASPGESFLKSSVSSCALEKGNLATGTTKRGKPSLQYLTLAFDDRFAPGTAEVLVGSTDFERSSI